MTVEKLEFYPFSKIWGGDRIGELLDLELKSCGEVWFGAKDIKDIQGNYLAKLIDAQRSLSIQVHPDHFQANMLEKKLGKNECWLILEAQKGAGVYVGLKNDTDLNHFFESCSIDNQVVNQQLRFHEVSAGDFIDIPAGMIHSIGAGVLLYEIQNVSDVTYRIWDWNRRSEGGNSKRELHLDKARSCVHESINRLPAGDFIRKNVFSKFGNYLLREFDKFKIELLNLEENIELGRYLRPGEDFILLKGSIKESRDEIKKYFPYRVSESFLEGSWNTTSRCSIVVIKNL